MARLVSMRPQSYPPGLWVVRFRLRAETPALSFSPDAHVRFAGCEDRQDRVGPGGGDPHIRRTEHEHLERRIAQAFPRAIETAQPTAPVDKTGDELRRGERCR